MEPRINKRAPTATSVTPRGMTVFSCVKKTRTQAPDVARTIPAMTARSAINEVVHRHSGAPKKPILEIYTSVCDSPGSLLWHEFGELGVVEYVERGIAEFFVTNASHFHFEFRFDWTATSTAAGIRGAK